MAFGAGYSAPDCPPPGAAGGAAAGHRPRRARGGGLAQRCAGRTGGAGDPVERYPQPRADERPAAPTRLRPPLFRRYRHPPAALQYQPAAVLAETLSAGAAGGRALSVFRQGLDPLSPDRRGGAGADGRQQLITQSAERQLVLGGDERDGAGRTAAAVSPSAGPGRSGRYAERRGGGADRTARRDASGRRGAGCL